MMALASRTQLAWPSAQMQHPAWSGAHMPTNGVIAQTRRRAVFMSALDEEDSMYKGSDDAAIEEIKIAISEVRAAGDGEQLLALVGELEKLNPTERCATSALIDGFWETVFASSSTAWSRGGRMRHVIESWTGGDTGPGAPGICADVRGARWADVAEGRGAYVQRARLRFGTREVRATYSWLGGEAWDIEYVSQSRLLFGIPLWKRSVRTAEANIDLDHAIRPTYVDGDVCILRSPAVIAAERTLRAERVYLLKRMRNRLWQDPFEGLSDRPVMGFELDP